MVSVDTLRLLARRAKIDSETRKLNANTIQDARLIASIRASPTISHWIGLMQSSERARCRSFSASNDNSRSDSA